MFCVIGNVTALAPSAEIGGLAMLWHVVEVGDSEDDAASGTGVRFMVAGAAVGIGGAAFAAMAGAVEDGAADFRPVFRVARPVFDGHGADSGMLWSVMMFPLQTSSISPHARAQRPPQGGFLLLVEKARRVPRGETDAPGVRTTIRRMADGPGLPAGETVKTAILGVFMGGVLPNPYRFGKIARRRTPARNFAILRRWSCPYSVFDLQFGMFFPQSGWRQTTALMAMPIENPNPAEHHPAGGADRTGLAIAHQRRARFDFPHRPTGQAEFRVGVGGPVGVG